MSGKKLCKFMTAKEFDDYLTKQAEKLATIENLKEIFSYLFSTMNVKSDSAKDIERLKKDLNEVNDVLSEMRIGISELFAEEDDEDNLNSSDEEFIPKEKKYKK